MTIKHTIPFALKLINTIEATCKIILILSLMINKIITIIITVIIIIMADTKQSRLN